MEKTIYIVIEQGAGIIHKAFYKRVDALSFVEVLKEQLCFDCFVIQALDLG
jgi:hypothetical protein